MRSNTRKLPNGITAGVGDINKMDRKVSTRHPIDGRTRRRTMKKIDLHTMNAKESKAIIRVMIGGDLAKIMHIILQTYGIEKVQV